MSNALENKLLLEQHLWDESLKDDSSRVIKTDTVEGFIQDNEIRIRELLKVNEIAKLYV